MTCPKETETELERVQRHLQDINPKWTITQETLDKVDREVAACAPMTDGQLRILSNIFRGCDSFMNALSP